MSTPRFTYLQAELLERPLGRRRRRHGHAVDVVGDGASAALVTADPQGIALGRFRAAVIPRSQDLITWHIGDSGFEMQLSGQVPGRIRRWLPEPSLHFC